MLLTIFAKRATNEMTGSWTTELYVGTKVCVWNGVYKGDANVYELVLYGLADALRRMGVKEDMTISVNDESVVRTANWILRDGGPEIDTEEVELFDSHRSDWNMLFKEIGDVHVYFQFSDRPLKNVFAWQEIGSKRPTTTKRRKK